MANPSYSITGTLTFPPDIGAAPLPVTFSGAGTFISRGDGVLNLTGAGTASIPIGTIPSAGIKAILIEVDPDTTPPSRLPVIVRFNGAVAGVEIAPGGCLMIHDPKPSVGVNQLDIDYTSDGVVRYWLLGD